MDDPMIARDILHNPRIVSTAVIACGVVLGSLAYTGSLSFVHTTTNNSEHAAYNKTPAQLLTEKDDNKNGIPDWQELRVSDTPEKNPQESTPTAPTREDLEKKYTKTELLAGDLFGVYLERKERGEYTTGDNDSIVANALASLDITNIPHFTENDITLYASEDIDTKGDTAASIYRDAVQTIITRLDSIEEYELQTYARATEKNDPAEFKKVSNAADVYATAVESLRKIRVPKDAAGAHLALMNGFTKLSLALLEMSKGYDDVAASYAALKTFGEAEKDIELAYTLHRTYLAIHNAINI